MKNRLLKQTMTMMLAFAMVFTMIPLLGVGMKVAHAAASAPGGTVQSNSKSNAEAAFGSGNASVSFDGNHNLTITLGSDITLNSPLKIVKGSAGDTVTIDLNGRSIKGANGSANATNSNSAKGKDAIQIVAADFDVVITDTSNGTKGSVTGGNGTAYILEQISYGADGGTAVSFVRNADNTYWNPSDNDAELKYGVNVSGGVTLVGGNGAGLTGDNWIDNIANYNGVDKYSILACPQFALNAGKGGSGIGQADTGVECGATTLSYAKIIIDNATIVGGNGGSLNMGTEKTPLLTNYGIMNNTAVISYMSGLTGDSSYDDYVDKNIKLRPGDGGDGIMIGAGRKYLHVKSAGKVYGGSCGGIDYGKSKLVNRIFNKIATAGNGVSVYGDVGLKNVAAVVNDGNWNSKTALSNDMGVFVEGEITGGSSPNSYGLYEDCSAAGAGIMINGKEEYISSGVDRYNHNILLGFPQGEDFINWGIIQIADSGKVQGGRGSDAVYGDGGNGGYGIAEVYTKNPDNEAGYSKYGTDYYVIKGEVIGGDGGNTKNGLSGSAENGLYFNNYRKGVRVFGNGAVSAGNNGGAVLRNSVPSDSCAEGVRFYPADRAYYDNSVVGISENSGQPEHNISVDNSDLSATASMTAFNDYPSSSTKLSCAVNKPSGYTGDVYITWFAETKLQSNKSEVFSLESAGNDYSSFNLLTNEQYKYLAYKTFPGVPDSDSMSYNIEGVGTVDRINYTIKHSNSWAKIWCVVMLDDGRWTKSNEMKFTNSGWDGTGPGGGGEDPGEDDMQERLRVINMIEALPSVGSITLSDRKDIEDAKDAFDALSDSQKEKIPKTDLDRLRNKLDAAVERLNDLLAANNVSYNISELADYIELSVENGAIVEDKRTQAGDVVSATRTSYDNLSDAQKGLVSSYDMEVLAAAEALFALSDDAYITAVGEFLSQYAPIDISEAVVTAPDVTYTGEAQKPAATVTLNGSQLVTNTDYYLVYSNNTYPGTATITAVGMGRYRNWASGTFEINDSQQPDPGPGPEPEPTPAPPAPAPYVAPVAPPAPTEIQDLPSVKASKPGKAKKSITVKWKKVNKKNLKKIGGIEMQITGPGVDKVVTAGKKKSSKKIKGLMSKQTYRCRVRAYNYIGGVKHVSAWSGWKSAKTK